MPIRILHGNPRGPKWKIPYFCESDLSRNRIHTGQLMLGTIGTEDRTDFATEIHFKNSSSLTAPCQDFGSALNLSCINADL